MRPLAAVTAAALLVACAADPGDDVPEGEDGAGDLDEVADDKADATSELRARIDGLTVWVDPVARVDTAGGQVRWVLDGRASRNLASVRAWVPDDAFGAATITGKRTFTITLRDGHEQNTLLSGLPIFVAVEPITGEPAEAAVWVAPRMARFAGSSRVYVDGTVTPVWVGGDVVYRGGASVASGWGDLAFATPADTNPAIVASGTRRWRLDWRFEDLAQVAALPGAPARAIAYRGDDVAEKAAAVEVRVVKLGLTRRDPREVWARACDADVAACLAALGPDTVDAGACGAYRDVAACGGPAAAAGPSPDQLAADLRGWLAFWYTQHGADVAAAGGNDLADAQAAVDPAAFVEVTDPEEDPYGHDLTEVRLYRHHDVVHPGSDIAWFLVYERASGVFLEAYDYN